MRNSVLVHFQKQLERVEISEMVEEVHDLGDDISAESETSDQVQKKRKTSCVVCEETNAHISVLHVLDLFILVGIDNGDFSEEVICNHPLKTKARGHKNFHKNLEDG